jgi:hypothetical protein
LIFYTYLWLREDGTPYYAGKGHSQRAYRKGCPANPENILIQEWPDETGAFEGEKLLIAIYGRKDLGTGILRNRTDGGEGASNPSMETRRKITAAHTKPRRPKRDWRCWALYVHQNLVRQLVTV